MTIAVYGDIHGNSIGLRAVAAEIDQIGCIDFEVCLGDIAWGGPGTSEIVSLLQERQAILLRGNHDEDILGFEEILNEIPVEHRTNAKIWNRWLRERFSREELDYLKNAPMSKSFKLKNDQEIIFCHCTPQSNRQRLLGPDAKQEDRDHWFSKIPHALLCCGHWHEPISLQHGDLRIICPGSIGMREDGLARWLLLQYSQAETVFDFRSTAYDSQDYDRMCLENAMPPLPRKIL